jgi:nucleoside-diphosphate-sugar epimerase
MRCVLFGGSGEVGGAVARALLESDVCSSLTLLGRIAVTGLDEDARVRQIVTDTGAADFEEVVKEAALGHDAAISCIGIGSGTASMSEEQMMEIEVHVFGRYARGCKAAGIEIFEFLSAVSVTETYATSRIKALRVGGKKYLTALEVGFEKLAIFKPGMIVGNAHTPGWITVFTGLIPDSLGWGNIRQEEVARAFGNKEMKQLIRE